MMHPSLLSQARVLINLVSHQHEVPLPLEMVDQLAKLLGVAAMRGPEGLSCIVEDAVTEACATGRGVVS